MMQQFLLDNFRRYQARGIEAHRRGDHKTARTSLLKAAELLFKLAAGSQGELKRIRQEKAYKLLEMAKSIAAKPSPTPLREERLAPQGEEADEGRGERWIVTDVPEVSFDDVAGLEDVKAVIRKRVIYPFQHPEVARKYRKQAGGGVLLYGPPGTGKTLIAKAVASEVDAAFLSARCSDVMSKWVGDAERNIKGLFDAARQRPRAVLFMDETEALVPKRGGDSTVMNRVIPEFLTQLDGIQGRHSGLLVLGATNRPWDIDEAALRPGRFGELVYVGLPDLPARRAIVAAALKGIPMAGEVDIDSLAADAAGLSGADLVGLCELAKDGPYEREIKTGVPQELELEDVQAARASLRPSVSAAQLARYEDFRRGLRAAR
ncbi:MAG: ATP-binding protein [Planctomycetes bacterium]|nr:ATP-binding protein [Planctomycetota bacterium]